jgi:antitoxin ParD1/3/4
MVDLALEHWVRNEVVAAYDEMKADPSRGLSIEQVRTSLAAEHERVKKARRKPVNTR